jgi:hypothetical protein
VARTSIPKIGIVAKLMAKEVVTTQPIPQPLPPFPSGEEEIMSQPHVRSFIQTDDKTKILANKVFKVPAASLVERGAKGVRDHRTAQNLIIEYNLMVKDVKKTLMSDLFVQALEELKYLSDSDTGAKSVSIMAKGIEVYVTSFIATDALKESAALLSKVASQGVSWHHAGRTLIEDYNILIREAKSVLKNDTFIQVLGELEYPGDYDVAAHTVARMAKKLELILAAYQTGTNR